MLRRDCTAARWRVSWVLHAKLGGVGEGVSAVRDDGGCKREKGMDEDGLLVFVGMKGTQAQLSAMTGRAHVSSRRLYPETI